MELRLESANGSREQEIQRINHPFGSVRAGSAHWHLLCAEGYCAKPVLAVTCPAKQHVWHTEAARAMMTERDKYKAG